MAPINPVIGVELEEAVADSADVGSSVAPTGTGRSVDDELTVGFGVVVGRPMDGVGS